MAKLDLQNVLKKSTESLKNTVDSLPDSLKNIDLKISMNDLAEKGSKTLSTVKKISEETVKNISEVLDKDNYIYGKLTVSNALSVIYFTMAIDGQITKEESDTFLSIAHEMDSQFSEYKNDFLENINKKITDAEDEDYEDNIRDMIRDIIKSPQSSKQSLIEGNMLVWNLLAIAYSDNDCSDVERKIIRFISKQLDLDSVIVLEMENYVKTLMALENEVQELKESNKAYSVVESRLNELSDRKLAIMQGVYALLND